MRKKDKLTREMLEYKITGRLPRKFRKETNKEWWMSDAELRRTLKLDDVEQESQNG